MQVAYKNTISEAPPSSEELLYQKEKEILETVSVIEQTMKETKMIFNRIEQSIEELKKNLKKQKTVDLSEEKDRIVPSL